MQIKKLITTRQIIAFLKKAPNKRFNLMSAVRCPAAVKTGRGMDGFIAFERNAYDHRNNRVCIVDPEWSLFLTWMWETDSIRASKNLKGIQVVNAFLKFKKANIITTKTFEKEKRDFKETYGIDISESFQKP